MAGRKKKVINWDTVDVYLRCQCDGTGIASILGVSPMTLYRACKDTHKVNFDAYSQQKKAEGKELLKKRQFEVAMSGDKTLLVWLGKNYADQKDRSDVTSDDKPIAVSAPVITVTSDKVAEQLKAIADAGK